MLYDVDITRRAAAFCQPLDGDLEPRFLGVIPVPNIPGEARYASHKKLLGELARHPRGHWAIYEQDGKFDAWISDGIGGTATESGNKFIYDESSAPQLVFENVYATTLGMMVYLRRSQIHAEIIKATLTNSNLSPGTRFKDRRFQGKNWSNIVFLGVEAGYYCGGGNAYLIRASRRGVRTQEFRLEPNAFFDLLKLDPIMPAQYVDQNNSGRLSSLYERRTAEAQNLWDRLTSGDLNIIDRMKALRELDRADAYEFDMFGSKAPFRTDGDRYTRTAYTTSRGVKGPTFIFCVTFHPGSAEIAASTITAKGKLPCPKSPTQSAGSSPKRIGNILKTFANA